MMKTLNPIFAGNMMTQASISIVYGSQTGMNQNPLAGFTNGQYEH